MKPYTLLLLGLLLASAAEAQTTDEARLEVTVTDAASGEADNVVVNAPHTAAEICGEWSHPYTREKAAFPLEFIRESKFFPYVSKIDNGYGDRNLVCRCTE